MVHPMHAAPEGLPQLGKLLHQTATVSKQLHNPKHIYLVDLARAWDNLQVALAEVCMFVKTMMAYTELDSVRSSDMLGAQPTSMFMCVFAHNPEEMSNKPTAELQKRYQEAIEKLPDPDRPKICADLKRFWDLWLPAREEVSERGPAVAARYELFHLVGFILDSQYSELEYERFDSTSFPEADARTIFSGFTDLRPSLTKSHESQSVDRAIGLVKERAAQGYDLDKLRAGSENDGSIPSGQDPRTGIAGTLSSEDRTGLDISLLRSHLMPRMKDISPQLVESLRNGYRLLVTEADDKRDRNDWRADDSKDLAGIFKAVQEALTYRDESSINPESTNPPTVASSGPWDIYRGDPS